MDTQSLKTLQESLKPHQEWKATLLFDLSDAGDGSDVVDLMDFVGQLETRPSRQVVFPAGRYPATAEGRKKLQKDLQEAALKSGYKLNRHKTPADLSKFVMACSRSDQYRAHSANRKNSSQLPSTKEKENAEPVYKDVRSTHMQGNKTKGSRGEEGRKMPRMSSTSKALSPKECCRMAFTVHRQPDLNHWYMKGGLGNPNHSGHIHLNTDELPIGQKEVDDEDKEMIAKLVDLGGGPTLAQTLYKEKTGRLLTEQQCTRIHQDFKKKKLGVENGKGLSTAEGLLKWLKAETDIDYIALFHSNVETSLISERGKGRPPKASSKLTAEIHRTDGTVDTVETNFPDKEAQDSIDKKIAPLRERLRVGSKVLLAVAWVRGPERRLFELFPEVTFSDVTSKTNKESRPLFVMAGKDSTGRSFRVIQCFMPSECEWVFYWLWDTAVPSLLGKGNVERIQLNITDGDDNMYDPFVALAKKWYPNSMHVLCNYHLVIQPIEKLPLVNKDKDVVKQDIKTFQVWIQSWMTFGGVETEAEFQLSLSQLYKWLRELDTTVHLNNGERMQEYLEKSVLPHKDRWFSHYGSIAAALAKGRHRQSRARTPL